MPTIGLEWINDYHANTLNLTNNERNVHGFESALGAVHVFDNGDDNSVDMNFEPDGESPCLADSVDLVYFSGHGNFEGPLFGVDTRDDGVAMLARMRLGRERCKWAVLDACEILQRGGDDWNVRFGTVFEGLHYLFGFDTIASDSPNRGRLFGQKLKSGSSVREAWIRAATETEEPDRQLAYVRASIEGIDTYNEGFTGSPARDEAAASRNEAPYYYFRTHC